MFLKIICMCFRSCNPATCVVTSNKDVENYLRKYGYFGQQSLRYRRHVTNLTSAIKKYPTFYNLTSTGLMDNDTLKHMNSLRCGNSDFSYDSTDRNLVESRYLSESASPRIIKTSISWKITEYPYLVGGLTSEIVDSAARQAMQMWSDVCNLNFYQTSSYDPDIVLKFQFPSNHNSWCSENFDDQVIGHYINGSQNPKQTHYNDQFYWSTNRYDRSAQKYLVTIIAHEIGHALGFAHYGGRDSVMYASYNSDVTELSSEDIATCVGRYGARSLSSDTSDSNACPSTVTYYDKNGNGDLFSVCAVIYDEPNCAGIGMRLGNNYLANLNDVSKYGGGNWYDDIFQKF